MVLTIGSVVISILEIVCLWMVAKRYRSGWIINVAVNTLWIPYDFITQQYGFIGLSVVYYYIAYIGWKHFHEGGTSNAQANEG